MSRRVLALDSCGRVTTLALGELREDALTLLGTGQLAPRTVSADLVPALGRLLGATAPQELMALVVVRGPGSFTGLRAGLSAIKALAEAAGLPVLGLSRLAVLASLASCQAAALDAGRGQVYLRAMETESLLTRADAAGLLNEGAVAICEDRLAGLFPGARRVGEPTAADSLRFAEPRLRAADWDNVLTLDALYLWREEQMFARPGA